jgi:hypothetical protein
MAKLTWHLNALQLPRRTIKTAEKGQEIEQLASAVGKTGCTRIAVCARPRPSCEAASSSSPEHQAWVPIALGFVLGGRHRRRSPVAAAHAHANRRHLRHDQPRSRLVEAEWDAQIAGNRATRVAPTFGVPSSPRVNQGAPATSRRRSGPWTAARPWITTLWAAVGVGQRAIAEGACLDVGSPRSTTSRSPLTRHLQRSASCSTIPGSDIASSRKPRPGS